MAEAEKTPAQSDTAKAPATSDAAPKPDPRRMPTGNTGTKGDTLPITTKDATGNC